MFAIRNLRENHINNQRLIEMLRRQGTISKQMMKQMNKNVATSNYRFCVPGHKDPPENGLPIELLDMFGSERKRYLRSYFTGGDPELLANISCSSDSSSGNDCGNKHASNRKKCRKPKREYHKYSSSSSSSLTYRSEDGSAEDEKADSENKPVQKTSNSVARTNKDRDVENHNYDFESEEECSNLMSSMSISGTCQSSQSNGTENTYLYENFEKDKQQRRFTE